MFSMTSLGMVDVPNPSELFMSSRYVRKYACLTYRNLNFT